MTHALLSKSKYIVGLQCPKALWIHYNNKALIPEVNEGTQALIDLIVALKRLVGSGGQGK